MARPLRETEKRSSLSYMLGFTDGLMWALCNPDAFLELVEQVQPDNPSHAGIKSLAFQASEIYDELHASPYRWQTAVPRDRLIELQPQPELFRRGD